MPIDAAILACLDMTTPTLGNTVDLARSNHPMLLHQGIEALIHPRLNRLNTAAAISVV
jgi:hypothetical protein